jgi:polysaccharide export outer membrane protein
MDHSSSRLTPAALLGHSVSGSFFSMLVTFREVFSSLMVKLVCLPVALTMWGAHPTYGQQKEQTPQQTNQKIQQLAAVARARPSDSPIGSGDLLHIDVFDIPELSREMRVSESGDISYPLIPGKIVAAGVTPFQLEEKIEQLLIENGLVTHPQVSVFVKEQVSQPISIVGAVARPMVYQIIRPTTLLELLAQAGGITDDAGGAVLITRSRPGAELVLVKDNATPSTNDALAGPSDPPPDTQTITIQLRDLLDSGNSAFNVSVYGGDSVSIPRAGIVFVTGYGVAQPGGYVMQSHGEQITVLKAVALAHGLTNFAKPDAAIILRRNPLTGNKDAIPVHIKQIENHKTDDVPMFSNDILYIPDSAGKKALARGAEAAVGIGTGLLVYRSGSL